MLFNVAILKFPNHAALMDGTAKAEVLYGPVTIVGDDSSALALQAVSDATKAGNLPNGYDPQSMRVVGHRFDCLI